MGGTGADSLYGGTGIDSFVFVDLIEGSVFPTTWDFIFDFESGEKIDLSAIDAFGDPDPANAAFTWIGTAAFAANTPGQLRYETVVSGPTVYYKLQSSIGNGVTSVFEVWVSNSTFTAFTLQASDFIL